MITVKCLEGLSNALFRFSFGVLFCSYRSFNEGMKGEEELVTGKQYNVLHYEKSNSKM